MATAFCPKCGTPRVGAFRYCRSCQFDFDTVASQAAAPTPMPPAPAPAATQSFTEKYAGSQWSSGQAPPSATGVGHVDDIPGAIRGTGRIGIIVGALALTVVSLVLFGGVSGAFKGGSGLGGPSAADLPPAGSIWFGRSFDPNTFVMSGRTTTAGTNSPFSFVARLTRSVKASEMAMRWSWNGSLVSNSGLNWQGEGDVWGGSAGPLFSAGTWRLELTDVGGNVLASGTLTVP